MWEKFKEFEQGPLMQQFYKRLKSLAWRSAMMFAVAVIAIFMDIIGQTHLSPTAIAFIGLIAGEITKFLNSQAPKE